MNKRIKKKKKTREYTSSSPQNLSSRDRDGITKPVNNPFAVILACMETSQGKGRETSLEDTAKLPGKGSGQPELGSRLWKWKEDAFGQYA